MELSSAYRLQATSQCQQEKKVPLRAGYGAKGCKPQWGFFDESAQNYVQGAYEAANAMTRSALEHQVQEIAQRISAMRANEPIPQRNRNFIGPVDYRNYLETTRFLEASEKSFLDHFYHYASTNGSTSRCFIRGRGPPTPVRSSRDRPALR